MTILEQEEFEEELQEILTDENASAIVTTLRLYAPLNLKGISNLLGKAESTLHRHMTKLRDKGLVVPVDDVDLPGKYYKLAPELSNYYEKKIETAIDEYSSESSEFLERLNDAKNEDSERYREARENLIKDVIKGMEDLRARKESIEASFTVNKNIQSLILQQILQFDPSDDLTVENLSEYLEEPPLISAMSQINTTIEVTRAQDMLEIINDMVNLIEKIQQVNKRSKKHLQENPDAKSRLYYFYLFSGHLEKEIDF